MQETSQPKLSAPPSIDTKGDSAGVLHARTPIVVVDSFPPPGASVPPNSSRYSLRSVRPLATSVRPSRSIFPSEDASSDLPGRRRTRGMAVLATAVVVLGAGAAGLANNSRSQGPTLTREVVSGRAGLRTTPTGAKESWSGSTPPAFVLDPSLDQIDPSAKAAIIDAFATWDSDGLGVPKASFTISSAAGKVAQDGVSRIVYAPIEVSGMEDALAITIGYANPYTGEVEEADVVFNSKYTFHVFQPAAAAKTTDDDSICSGDYDVQNVATHEAGHVYGLGEDMQDTTTTMYVRSAPCETHKRVLSASDKQVMTALYVATASSSSASSTHAGCGKATIARTETSAGWGWIACGLAALVSLRRRLRRA